VIYVKCQRRGSPRENALKPSRYDPKMPDSENNKKHVLVVEDEIFSRLFAMHVLRSMECRASEASNGLEALQMILAQLERGDPYDLLMLDIEMPLMKGTELMDELWAKGISIPVIILSGDIDVETIAEASKYICNGYLKKPYDANALIRLVNNQFNEEGSNKNVAGKHL
jgi:CheY-like chemotaxis protein